VEFCSVKSGKWFKLGPLSFSALFLPPPFWV
jgi:hypothetical protein